MHRLFLPPMFALTACGGAGAEAPIGDAPSAPMEAAPSDVEGRAVRTDLPGRVGRLVLNERFSVKHPSEYCLDDGFVYQGAPARIGGLNVFTDAPLASLAGEIVLARGSSTPSLMAELEKLGPCPADYGSDSVETPQMRADHVSPERGFMTTIAHLQALPAFRAPRVERLDLGGEVTASGEHVVVELRNPFDAPLDALTAHAHYEGGPGKPMPRFEPLVLDLPPGGTQRFELPTRIAAAEPARGAYLLHSLDIEGRLGEVELDVELPVNLARVREEPPAR